MFSAVQANVKVIYSIIVLQKKMFYFLVHNICSKTMFMLHIQVLRPKHVSKLNGA